MGDTCSCHRTHCLKHVPSHIGSGGMQIPRGVRGRAGEKTSYTGQCIVPPDAVCRSVPTTGHARLKCVPSHKYTALWVHKPGVGGVGEVRSVNCGGAI